MSKTEQFKNYYDIEGNLLSGDLRIVTDPETKESLMYVNDIRVHRVVDSNAKVLINVYAGDKISHTHTASVVVSKDPTVMFAYQECGAIVLPELTNFRLTLNPVKGQLGIYKQMPDNTWAEASLGDTTKFVLVHGGSQLFMIKYFEGEGWAFQALTKFLGLKATRIDITVQTD